MNEAATRVLIVDDHPILRQGLAQLISQTRRWQVCHQAATVEAALAAQVACVHRLAIVDLSLAHGSGLELVKRFAATPGAPAVLVLSMHDERLYAEKALHAGARGYIMKQEASEHVLEALETLQRGGTYLSAAMRDELQQRAPGARADPLSRLSGRELEILRLIGQGRATAEIAAALERSVKTIESHRESLKLKLGLKSSAELLRYAVLWEQERRS